MTMIESLRRWLLLIIERGLMLIVRYSARLVNWTLQARGVAETQFIVVVSPKVRDAVEIATPRVRMVSTDRGKGSEQKMLRVLRLLRRIPLLSELEGSRSAKRGWKEYANKSQLRWIAETALQIREGRLRMEG